jgi:hypothetical protein
VLTNFVEKVSWGSFKSLEKGTFCCSVHRFSRELSSIVSSINFGKGNEEFIHLRDSTDYWHFIQKIKKKREKKKKKKIVFKGYRH